MIFTTNAEKSEIAGKSEKGTTKKQTLRRRVIGAAAILFWLAVWQAVSMAVGNDILLVSPIAVIKRLFELVVTAEFWHSVGLSFIRIISGFLLALAAGLALALLASASSVIKQLLSPLMTAIKTVPVASFIILVLIWFPSKRLSTVISFLMVLPIIYTNTLSAIASLRDDLDEMATVFRIPPLRRLRCVCLPQVMPGFLTGCELSLGLCWKSGIAAEVIGIPKHSIGEALQQAKIYLDTPDLFAWTVVIVAVSALFAKLFMSAMKLLEKRITRV